MRKAFKFRLYPTKKQEKLLFWTLTRCRELYNAALQERKEAYEMAGKSISYYEQKRDLVEIKAALRPEYQDIHSQVVQDVLLRLKRAFDHFFRRVKNGEEPGYPRFQGRNRYHSFTYPQGGYSLTHDHRVCLSKIGSIKMMLHRKMEGTIKTCTIEYQAGQWYVVFSCEVEHPEPLPPLESEIGIDLGITHFAAISDGTFIESPRFFCQAQADLKRKQHALSRKKRGSHRREKARKVLAKAHRKVANQRRDFHHKQANKLVKEHQVIVFEELQLMNLVRSPKAKQDENGMYLPNGAAAKGGLNKSMLDAGWGQFVQIVTSKAAWAGRVVAKINPMKTSQICSACGKQGPHKDLDERIHICIHCGVVLDRDENAAINIYTAWKRPTLWASLCGKRD
ncbi:MAG TPA: transposase [Ktedonobacteraceae bacterium]|nr:transposase [Ktedonobacteraceae bacterium]